MFAQIGGLSPIRRLKAHALFCVRYPHPKSFPSGKGLILGEGTYPRPSGLQKRCFALAKLESFIHEPLDTHLRSLLERLVHDLNLLELAV